MRITVLVGFLVAIAASVFPMGKREEMVNIGTLFAFVLVAGVIVLRRTRPDLARGFRVLWVPLLPIVAILACVWLMLNLTGLTWIRSPSGRTRLRRDLLRPAQLITPNPRQVEPFGCSEHLPLRAK